MAQITFEIEDGLVIINREDGSIADFYPEDALRNQLDDNIVLLGYAIDGFRVELRGNVIRIYDLEANVDFVDHDADPLYVDGIHQHYKVPNNFRELLRQFLINNNM